MTVQPIDHCSFFLPISKIDKEQRMVWGYASTPTKDLDGEIVALEAIKSALPDYMEWGNIREMHQSSAVGVTKEANVDSGGLYIGAKVVDDAAWNKVLEEVYKGFSIGGRKLAKVKDTITSLELIEISLVDRPANPDCRIEVIKSAKPVDGAAAELVKGAGFPPLPIVIADAAETLVLDRAEVGLLGRLFAKLSGNPLAAVEKRDVPDKERTHLADEGHAMPDGSYPIKNVGDLENAVQAFGRAKDPEGVKRHIIREAKRLGRTDALPADWPGSTKDKGGKKAATVLGSTTLDLEKGMNVVAWLANAFEMIRQSQRSLMVEEGVEGDGEDKLLADSLGAIAASLANVIGDKAHHEGDEARTLTDADDLNFAQWTGVELAMSANSTGGLPLGKRMSAANKGALGKAAHHISKALEHHGQMAEACAKLAGLHKEHASKAAGGFPHEEAMDHLHKIAAHHEAMGDHMEVAQSQVGKAASGGGAAEGEGDGDGGAADWGNLHQTGGPSRPAAPGYSATDQYPGKGAHVPIPEGFVSKGEAEAREKAAKLEGELAALRRTPAGAPRAGFTVPANLPASDPKAQRVSKMLDGVPTLKPDGEGEAEKSAAIMIANVLNPANAGVFRRTIVDADYRGSIGRERVG